MTHRFIRYSLRLFVSVLFANVNASLARAFVHSSGCPSFFGGREEGVGAEASASELLFPYSTDLGKFRVRFGRKFKKIRT